MLRTCHRTPGRPTTPTSPLRALWEALPEGLAAYRQYEHLRSRGVPRDTALRAAVGATRETARPHRHGLPIGIALSA